MAVRWSAALGAAGMLAVPLSALACPDGPEAARAGVVVSYDDGSATSYRRDGDGFVTEITLFAEPEGEGYGVVALHGLYMVEEYDILRGQPDASTRERQRFDLGLKALPLPAPGLGWSGAAHVAFGPDPEIPREVSLAIGSPERVSYGGCGYESWPVLLRHRDAAEDYMLGLDYLPSLGIAVLRSYAEFGDTPESYNPTGIAAATR